MGIDERTTVLVVDDEIDMRFLVRTVLELASRGLEIVAEAVDGTDALDVFDRIEGPPDPDVVILDNRMPNLSGIETAKRILSQRPGQKIILFSAFLDAEVQAEAAAAGIAECVTKEDAEHLPTLVWRLTA